MTRDLLRARIIQAAEATDPYPGDASIAVLAAAAEALRIAREQIDDRQLRDVGHLTEYGQTVFKTREQDLQLLDDLLSSLLGPQGEEKKEDHGAALLPADPSASVKTETLPNKEDYYWSCEEVRAVLRLAERAHKDWRWALDQLDAVPASASVSAGEASPNTAQERESRSDRLKA